jgi:hypothetical protein
MVTKIKRKYEMIFEAFGESIAIVEGRVKQAEMSSLWSISTADLQLFTEV